MSQKTYTNTQITEITQWFEAHKTSLPSSLRLNAGFYIPDLPTTVQHYCALAQQLHSNPTYSAQISHLFSIREALTEADA